jgi:hypothetical protein
MGQRRRRAYARVITLGVGALLGALVPLAHAASHVDRLPSWLSGPRASTAGASGLPPSWCGARVARDQYRRSRAAEEPAVRLVYAHPSDREDRGLLMAGMLQQSAREIALYVARGSGGRKTIRFDTRTRCGRGYLDIAIVTLAHPRTWYLGPGGVAKEEIRREVRMAVGRSPGPRNQVVYVDNLLDGPSFGEADIILGASDMPGADNPHNEGGLYGFVWTQDGASLDLAQTSYLVLHELSHTLGAVQDDSPNATGSGHCRDEIDVMCRPDGGPGGDVFGACPALAGVIAGHFDCNHDDYFDPTPARGSYLASHWNVFDSAFLASCGERPRACGRTARSQ